MCHCHFHCQPTAKQKKESLQFKASKKLDVVKTFRELNSAVVGVTFKPMDFGT